MGWTASFEMSLDGISFISEMGDREEELRVLIKYLHKAAHAPHANRVAVLVAIPRLIL